jgi:hypothetical protein
VKTVPATVKLLSLLQGSGFIVLDDFHPNFPDSLTLVDPDTRSAVTIGVLEAADSHDVAACQPDHRDQYNVCHRLGCWRYGRTQPRKEDGR